MLTQASTVSHRAAQLKTYLPKRICTLDDWYLYKLRLIQKLYIGAKAQRRLDLRTLK